MIGPNVHVALTNTHLNNVHKIHLSVDFIIQYSYNKNISGMRHNKNI